MIIRRLTDPLSFAQVERLYSDVFGGALNHRLVVGLAANSGYVLGAFEDEALVGYGLSFLAREDGRMYQYSQTVCVEPSAQGRGVGRAIKYAQRDAALADGIDLIRWSFDPMHARNAHFNLDVLGGRIRRLHKDFYGEGTDRFVVDWELAAPRSRVEWDVPALHPGQITDIGSGAAIAIPAAEPADDLRPVVRSQCAGALARGLVGVSCRRADENAAVYLFAPS